MARNSLLSKAPDSPDSRAEPLWSPYPQARAHHGRGRIAARAGVGAVVLAMGIALTAGPMAAAALAGSNPCVKARRTAPHWIRVLQGKWPISAAAVGQEVRVVITVHDRRGRSFTALVETSSGSDYDGEYIEVRGGRVTAVESAPSNNPYFSTATHTPATADVSLNVSSDTGSLAWVACQPLAYS